MLGDVGVKAGADDKGSARVHGAVSLVLGQDGSGAQQHFGHFGVNLADALLRAGDLGSGKSAVCQGLTQGKGLVNAVEGDDRDDTNLVYLFNNWVHFDSPHLIELEYLWKRAGGRAHLPDFSNTY